MFRNVAEFYCRPIAFERNSIHTLDEGLTANPYPTWQRLEELVEKGKIRNIGISKYVDLFRSNEYNIDAVYFVASTFVGQAGTE